MPIDITITINDEDMARFQRLVADAKDALAEPGHAARIESAARKLIDGIDSASMPQFVRERLDMLGLLIEMLHDEDWGLREDERRAILGALSYLCEADDLIADDTPAFGFLDDAIYIELVVRDLHQEITLYREFCQYRTEEAARRVAEGLDKNVNRRDWLAAKRNELHGKMRQRLVSRLKLW